jgi:predicted enzyme related to lactoylglutathione lyase
LKRYLVRIYSVKHIVTPNSGGREGRQLTGRFTGITLTVPDVEAAHRSLTSKGVRFSGPPARQPWGGMMTSFFDPDGNEISLLGMPQA